MSKPAKPIRQKVSGLRQRWRARTSEWRVWWEPNNVQRAAGFEVVELDGTRPTWSVRQAKDLNLQAGVQTPPPTTPKVMAQNSIDAVCAGYLHSPKFRNLAGKTQKEYRKDINRILTKWQGSDMRSLTKPVVFTWYEALYTAHGVAMSRRLVKMLSILMSYAELKGVVATNPLYRMQMITPKGRKRLATWDEFAALEAAAQILGDNGMQLALLLAMFQGQRATDIFTARASDFVVRKGAAASDLLHWQILRSKDTRLERHNQLVIHSEVAVILRQTLADVRAPTSRIVTRQDGAHYNDETFSKAFAVIRQKAAETCPSVADLQFRDLRRTFSNNARHANIASDDVDDALGNTSGTDPQMRQVYMPASDERAAAAINAIERPKEVRQRKG